MELFFSGDSGPNGCPGDLMFISFKPLVSDGVIFFGEGERETKVVLRILIFLYEHIGYSQTPPFIMIVHFF